ncbi:MAG TPA: flagellar export chaperone FliS [Acidobacteriota bacterium]|nr:flagellar export chaperone FliS [Acidobacteriota bacterium]
MSASFTPAQRYRETAITTANPVQLVVILYDAAICSLQEARRRIEHKDIEGRARAINKSISLISEMQSSLNHKDGGEIAVSLDRLYDYMKRTLFQANVQQNARLLAEVEALLENLVGAWRAILSPSGENQLPAKHQRGHMPLPVKSPESPAATRPETLNISI